MHMPCGLHGAPQTARLAIFMSDSSTWERCDHVNPEHAHGGRLPTVQELVVMGNRLAVEEPDTPLHELVDVLKKRRAQPAKAHTAAVLQQLAAEVAG